MTVLSDAAFDFRYHMMLRVIPIGTTHVVLWPHFLSASECAAIRSAMDAAERSPAEIYDDGYRVDLRVRRTFEFDVDAAILRLVERRIAGAREAIEHAFGLTLNGSEGPGFLRYLSGGFYRVHQDALPHDPDRFPRQLSLVLFLTATSAGDRGDSDADACAGGALRLHGMADETCAPLDVAPARGLLAAFPARMVHEVLPVTQGVRDVVVDWLY